MENTEGRYSTYHKISDELEKYFTSIKRGKENKEYLKKIAEIIEKLEDQE